MKALSPGTAPRLPFNLCELTDSVKFRWVPHFNGKQRAIYGPQKGPIYCETLKLGHDMGGGGVQNVWGEENVPENAPSRIILDPSKRASGLLSRGFLYRKKQSNDTRAGFGKRTVQGGIQNPFLRRVSFMASSDVQGEAQKSPFCWRFS